MLICRENQRRERLNAHARDRLAERGELGESIVIAGHDWAVGDRVIARRNDRGRDLDNGMRATITAVDEHHGLNVRIDAGGYRHLDPEYAAHHLEHAYALTGHGMQGGTVEWAAVIGQAQDFTRNWSYTALSRAREPTRILLIDEPTRAQQEREEIAPAAPDLGPSGPLDRVSRRMRERDDEDLALEQLHNAQLAEQHSLEPPSGEPVVGEPTIEDRRPGDAVEPTPEITSGEPQVSPALEELADVRRELAELRVALEHPAIEDARHIAAARATIGAIQTEALRDSAPRDWRDRGAHQLRTSQRDRQLTDLRQREQQLLQRAPDPDAILAEAEQLRQDQSRLLHRAAELREQATTDELARRPTWLEETLGPEPAQPRARQRWEKTARQIASHRIRNDITDPTDPGIRPGDHALKRAITDTRTALGLDLPSPGHEQGHEIA